MRIRVTGYLELADIEPEHIDRDHEMGLSEAGLFYWTAELGLADVEFQAVDDDE